MRKKKKFPALKNLEFHIKHRRRRRGDGTVLQIIIIVVLPTQRPSHLRTIEKKVLFYFQKLKSVPVTQTSEKIIASFKVLS